MKNDIKDEFISTLSHEIRTPLTSIKGFSQTMLSSWEVLNDEKKKEFLKIILNQSQRLINLVENVLNVAKIDSNNENIILTKIEINQLLKNCLNLISVNNKDFDFNLNLFKNNLYILADNYKAQQIILNVLDNAIKYSKNSNKIDIKTFNKEDYIALSIKNYGSYIEEKDFEKIFEKFYRIDSYITSSTQGSGLGLYIVKNLLEKMQGKIEINSSIEEKYVEFIIYFQSFEIEKQTNGTGVKIV